MIRALARRPWLVIAAGFLVFVAALAGLVVVAVRNEPATIPVERAGPPARGRGLRDAAVAGGVLAACVAGCGVLVYRARHRYQTPTSEDTAHERP